MWRLITSFYIFQLLAVIVIIVIGYLFWDKRYKKRQTLTIPHGFIRTEEVNIDPLTNKKQRVYYNPDNGERLYIDEV